MPGALAGPEGIEPSAVGFGDRGATLARAFANGTMHLAAHDGVRGFESGAGGGTRRFGYQLMPGLPNFGISRARRPGLNKRSAGQARGHAEDGVGITPLRLLGEKFACHRRTIVSHAAAAVKRIS